MSTSKRFSIQTTDTGADVLGGPVSENNAYICCYPKVTGKPIADLAIGESTLAEYSLSGSHGFYRIVRVTDSVAECGR